MSELFAHEESPAVSPIFVSFGTPAEFQWTFRQSALLSRRGLIHCARAVFAALPSLRACQPVHQGLTCYRALPCSPVAPRFGPRLFDEQAVWVDPTPVPALVDLQQQIFGIRLRFDHRHQRGVPAYVRREAD